MAEEINRIESESGIVATLIHHPDFSFHSEYLQKEHFTNRDNRILYNAITGMAKEGMETRSDVLPYSLLRLFLDHEIRGKRHPS